MDLCDTALEISTPTIKETLTHLEDGDIRTQSPQSESRISQVSQWQSPSTNTLEQEQGLALLCADTEKAAKAKVDAVMRHRQILEYSERIRIELAVVVQDCVDEAMRRAARIAAGELSDTESGEEYDVPAEGSISRPVERSIPEEEIHDESHDEGHEEGDTVIHTDSLRSHTEEATFQQHLTSPSALAAALRKVDLSASGTSQSRPTSFIGSGGSNSPKECLTPRSHAGASVSGQAGGRDGRRRSSLWLGSDAGDLDESFRSSSIMSRAGARNDSPISEFGDLRRAASTRQRQRRSLVIPGATSPRRQESPSRAAATQPSSPLRIKPRMIPGASDVLVSPEASPMFPSSEFSSPVAHPIRHHRRQSSAAISDFVMRPPPSPKMGATQAPPQARSNQPSIKDFEIIKPISKGAFGSVYLSKKKSTGEYFAIKVLKKADMVAKNQVGNVKAERAILMWQGESDFVAKLYWTFSSKDYLYLVMEYLNGGDCASLIKILGGLPEDWVKKYLAEVILGVEHLHERDIIHRDLKPDNLLIDQSGHLKLTDFGLSRMGLVGRQKRALNNENAETTPDLLKQGPFMRSVSVASSRSTSMDMHGNVTSPGVTPQIPLEVGSGGSQPSYFSLSSEPRRVSNGRSDSGGSETLTSLLAGFSLNDSDIASQGIVKSPPDDESILHGSSPDLAGSLPGMRASVDSHPRQSFAASNMMPPPMALFDPEDTTRRFVGTPDYIPPETINGEKQDETSDWWSVGCILFEFLFGIPPFHAGEAEEVFENILARKIQWPDEALLETVSDEAKDLINKLLCVDQTKRLGANHDGKYASGGEEIRHHPWFEGINWDTLLEDEAQFVPQPENPEDTEYFDARGATLQSFTEEIEDNSSAQSLPGPEYTDRPHDALSKARTSANPVSRKLMPLHIPPHVRDMKSRRLSEPVAADDFGNFSFKNLPVLEKANKDVIQKLRAEALAAQNKQSSGTSPGGLNSPAPSLEGSPVLANHLHRSLSTKSSTRPQSPSGFVTSSPSRGSQPGSPLLLSYVPGQGPEGRRKASSNASSLSQQSGPLSQVAAIDVPRVPPSLQKAATTAGSSSPVKNRASLSALGISPQKLMSTPRQASSSTTRSRSLTVGSTEASPAASDILSQHHRNRRSQVFDMSPSSSDTEGDKHNALLRVQRRRQSSRRLSQIAFDGLPTFRPLDVLICEDHPVSRMVMEKLLEKLRCRTISVSNGSEAVRYSMSEIKFDIIFVEYRLPQISGADVARMVRETKNANAQTPIVAITAYVKEVQGSHYFDSVMEKPISSSKLSEMLRSLCQWRPESPQRTTSGSQTSSQMMPALPTNMRRMTGPRTDDSPTSSVSMFAGKHGLMSSREDSVSSSIFGDSESVTTDEVPVVISRKGTGEWEEGGLGISEADILGGHEGASPKSIPPFLTQQSAPAQVESMIPRSHGGDPSSAPSRKGSKGSDGAESADDEEAGDGLEVREHRSRRGSKPLPSSKLGIEMMRANSHDSVTFGSESTPETVTRVATTPSQEHDDPIKTTPEANVNVPLTVITQATPRPGAQDESPRD